MRPIVRGARGPAVEDIQRRLLRLGYDLGPTGIDGVFLGKTSEAIAAFQAEHGLSEDSMVGDETWSALVDATFTLGDRTLYLRLPYFHGHDVGVLQRALSTLGFSCGEPDGIFGRRTERAVREFQLNCGQRDDGIAGTDTVRALFGLRHVWEGKDAPSPVGTVADTGSLVAPLLNFSVAIVGTDSATADIAQRFSNVAHALDDEVLVSDVVPDSRESVDVVISIVESAAFSEDDVPQVRLDWPVEPGLTGRLMTALSALPEDGGRMTVAIEGAARGEEELQRVAVALLDSLCAALARGLL